MAKGSAMGLWRGRKGSSVFYKITNSNNAQKQGIRERVYEIKNPETNAQTAQRIKLTPLANVYRELRDIIRRSWQGVEYGGRGYAQFAKENLTGEGKIPYLLKGDIRAVPGYYLISKGTIQAVQVNFEDNRNMGTSLRMKETEDDEIPSTWGELSSQLMEYNDIREGDQVTLVCCFATQSDMDNTEPWRFKWEVGSAYVDSTSVVDTTANSTGLAELFGIPEIDFISPFELNFGIHFATYDIAAAAIIISRPRDGVYLRSNATINVNGEVTGITDFFTAAQREKAEASYKTQSSGTRSVNWVVDTETRGGSGGRSTYDSNYTLTGGTSYGTQANGTVIKVRKYSDTNALAAVYIFDGTGREDARGALVRADNNVYLTWSDSGGANGPITKQYFPTLANLPTIADPDARPYA